jgi:parafibromin
MAPTDPLLLLRQAARANVSPTPTASADPGDTTAAPLALATHLLFAHGGDPVAVPLDTPTRFVSAGEPASLRSIFLAWISRDLTLPDYNVSAARLHEEPGTRPVQTLPFVERVDLYTWLEGASDDSDYIRPGAGGDGEGVGGDMGAAAAAAGASGEGGGAKGVGAAGAGAVGAGAGAGAGIGRSGRGTLDPRLLAVYNGERRTGDRNSVLRGIKPTVRFGVVPNIPSVFEATFHH